MDVKISTKHQLMNEIDEIGIHRMVSKDVGNIHLTKSWLTVSEVCSLLGISKRTLQSMRDRKLIPFIQIHRKIFFKVCDLDEFMNRHYIRAEYQKGGPR